jgi:hypothetical protein
MVFTLGNEYVVTLTKKPHWISVLILPIYTLAINNIILLLFSFAGSLNLTRLIYRSGYKDYQQLIIGLSILFWFFASILIAGYTRRGWPHYSLIIIPPLSILAAWEIIRLVGKMRSRLSKKSQTYLVAAVSILMILILLVSAVTNFQLYYHFLRYKFGLDTYYEFLLSDLHDGSGFVMMDHVADYIRRNTAPDDYIYSWSDNMQIYYLADRRGPIDMIWPIYASSTGSRNRIFSPDTKYIIIGNSQVVTIPEWVRANLAESYRLVAQFGSQKIYEHILH